jgi:hypothetical protein
VVDLVAVVQTLQAQETHHQLLHRKEIMAGQGLIQPINIQKAVVVVQVL